VTAAATALASELPRGDVWLFRNGVSAATEAIARPAGDAERDMKELTMNEQVVVVASIRPGKRDGLEKLLAAGPPFDLATSGFTNHHAFLGDRTVVFVFEGAAAREHVQDLSKRLPMAELARMGMLAHDPELLTEQLSWTSSGSEARAHP
jgi:hypothetical protein